MIYYLFILAAFCCTVLGQKTDTITPATEVSPAGFDDTNANLHVNDESWISKNEKYIIIAVVLFVVFCLLIWYITRSIRGMRERLAKENQNHMMMIQGVNGSGISETVPVDSHGFQKMSEYQQSPPGQYTHRY
ncbi:hypothetical protein BD770DRAFT_390220 [Pilaira anomala]|nr:hypothetical protein BD770DRAFT_390220 [Pilaira anomala]